MGTMRPIELMTRGVGAERVHVAFVEIPPFVSARMPDVVLWGSRVFTRETRPDADQRDGRAAWWYVEAFAVVSVTPATGLVACKVCGALWRRNVDRSTVLAAGEKAGHCCEGGALNPPPPVDRAAVTTLHGTPVGEHLEIQPSGQQKDYIVLTAEERAKGFVRPVRRSYRHEKCGSVTTMGVALAETWARDIAFYTGTFCSTCAAHFPVGPAGEFVWEGTSEKLGT